MTIESRPILDLPKGHDPRGNLTFVEGNTFVALIAGFNSRLDEIQAAVLRPKLRHLDRENAARAWLAIESVSAIAGPRCGASNHFRQLLKVWNRQTELSRFLLDADIIQPAFYEGHLQAHQLRRMSCPRSVRGLPGGAVPNARAALRARSRHGAVLRPDAGTGQGPARGRSAISGRLGRFPNVRAR